MRYDMDKVVTERPRYNHRLRYKHTGQRAANAQVFRHDSDLLSRCESMGWGRIIDRCEKSFSDLLGPLKGYLRSKVGSPWDAVYSEICATLPNNSVQGKHIRDHVKNYVDTNPIKIDNVYYQRDSFRSSWLRKFYEDDFYVNDSGILQVGKAQRVPAKEAKEKDKVRIGSVDYAKVDEIWYRVRWTRQEVSRIYDSRRGRFIVEYSTVLSFKKQLNSKELLRLGLKNH